MVDYFEIGYIANTHGLKGELKVKSYMSSEKRYEELEEILIDSNGTYQAYKIKQVRYQKDMVLLTLEGVDDINIAEKLKGHPIYMKREAAKKLQEDEYFIADLIGCEVFENNNLIGTIQDVFTAGASDVYNIKRNSKSDLLLPALKANIENIDIEARRVDVKIPRGLEDED